jgi:hypothetical protein
MTQDIFNEILATKDDTIAILKSTIEDMKVLVAEKDRLITTKEELIAALERGSSAKSAAVVSLEERMMDEYSWMMKGAA